MHPPPPPTIRRRKIALTASAIVLAVILMTVFVLRAGDMHALGATLRSGARNPRYLIPGMALFSVSLLCGLTRWYILLRTLNLPVKYREALRLYASGHFFNVVGPGATGGDFVKAAWIAATCPGQRTTAITSIAAERLIGLVAMVVFVTTISLFRRDFFENSPILAAFRLCIYIACGVALSVLVLLTRVDWNRVARHAHPRPGSIRDTLLQTLLRVWETFRICLTHPLATGAAFALSILNHITDVCCYFLLSRAIGMQIAFRDLLVISPIANTIAALPVTPGGAGVRENTLQWMMDIVHVPRHESTALGILMFATILGWALIAGLIMLTAIRNERLHLRTSPSHAHPVRD